MKKIFLLISFIGLFNDPAIADDSSLSSEDSQVTKMAREKSYPGGRDEEDLEVQTQVIKPVRKMGNAQENVEASSSDDEF